MIIRWLQAYGDEYGIRPSLLWEFQNEENFLAGLPYKEVCAEVVWRKPEITRDVGLVVEHKYVRRKYSGDVFSVLKEARSNGRTFKKRVPTTGPIEGLAPEAICKPVFRAIVVRETTKKWLKELVKEIAVRYNKYIVLLTPKNEAVWFKADRFKT